MSATIGFLTWTSPAPTGGNLYDDKVAAALEGTGAPLCRHRVSGTWPTEADRHRSEVAGALRAHRVWLVDSIIACAVPDLVAEVIDRGQQVTIVLHSLLSSEAGLSDADRQHYRSLEGVALRAATRVVTPSRWAADDLRSRYGITGALVARPGVDAASLADGSPGGTRLLCLGSLTPTKDQLSLVAALTRVVDLPWSARVVGGDQIQPDYAASVRAAVGHHRLNDRIELTGPLGGSALELVWAETDLLVVTSRSETYGMVVVEALAHGIPAIVSARTGAVEALGELDGEKPGATVPPGDPNALSAVIRQWLSDQRLRDRWRAVARRRRETLDSWNDTARTIQSLLTE